MPTFRTTLRQAEGMNATGLVVPTAIVDGLGQGKKPKVAFTHRQEHVRSIEEARSPQTRLRRIEKAVAMVEAKRK